MGKVLKKIIIAIAVIVVEVIVSLIVITNANNVWFRIAEFRILKIPTQKICKGEH